MTGKPVIPREQANREVDETIAYYLAEDYQPAPMGLIETLEQAYVHIGHYPGTGSSRYALELNLPNLRCWPLTRFPHLVFYVEHTDHIDVWRVLHGMRDIPVWMRGKDVV